jgi:hypothetical protein
MKAIISLSVIFLSLTANAQSFYDSLHVNNLHASFKASGDIFYNPTNFSRGLTFNNQPFVDGAFGNLWIGGYDANNNLHIAAQTYRQTGDDFWSGALDTTTATCSFTQNVAYNKVWKLGCEEVSDYVDYLNGLGAPGYSVPLNIQTWPGNGNVSVGEARHLAPYFDADGDGYYNWQAGDYPVVRGHQSLFYVYNDALVNSTHTESGGTKLGVEIRVMPYAFNVGWSNAVSNTVFVHYTIINRSTTQYNFTKVGVWNDIDLLSPGSNYSGSDSVLNCFYNYDPTSAFGTVFLNRTMSGCINYSNDFSVTGNPTTAAEYYGYMNQQWKDSSPLTLNGNGYGGTTNTTWMYSGDPSTSSGWNDVLFPSDDRAIGSTQSFTFMPGMVYEFDIAFVAATDTVAPYGCVNVLKQSIQEVKNFYANEVQFCTPGITGINNINATKTSLTIFPNPASAQLTIQTSTAQPQSYSISDLSGKILQSGNTLTKETVVDIQKLAPGMYFVQVGDGAKIETLKFVKAE